VVAGSISVLPPRLDGEHVVLDARTRLAALAAGGPEIPRILAEVAGRVTAPAPATLASEIAAGDGASPLLTLLLAMDSEVESAGMRWPLDEVLDDRAGRYRAADVVRVRWLDLAAYDAVTRAPGEPPILCVAVARPVSGGRREFRVALGGYGTRPVLVEPLILGDGYDVEAAAKAAGRLYATAADERAAGPIRSETATVLTRRLLGEIFA
jgi:CO/xanthine dehydrogenase FAD-binding subunit